jgi:hypothetical protein
MDGPTLQNLISKGRGVAARRLGTPFVVLRPRGICNPLATSNRVVKLNAVFNAEDESFRRVTGYGDAVWWGVFDSLYTKPGDYLSGCDTGGNTVVYFIAAQRQLLPAQCVKTNRVVNVSRPPAPASSGYGGMVLEAAMTVIKGWPSGVLAQSARVSGALPEQRFGIWTALLPSMPATILAGDVVTDEIGRTFLVASAEQSELGWRLTIKQVAG